MGVVWNKKAKPSIMIAMPCHDSVKINTMLSIIKLIQQVSFPSGRKGIPIGINTMKSSMVHQARNYLVSEFMATEYTHLLFVDSDVEFEPDAVLRMLLSNKDIICTPYRLKDPDLSRATYNVALKKDAVREGDNIEIIAGPTGLMLIKRGVFTKIIELHPELKITNPAIKNPGKSHDFYYNFYNFGFEDGYLIGEDVSFCKLAIKSGFKLYANVASVTQHHGSYAWEGRYQDEME